MNVKSITLIQSHIYGGSEFITRKGTFTVLLTTPLADAIIEYLSTLDASAE
jgi:hypothetical protein